METDFYRVYSEFLREKYGEKVYKLPVNLPLTCPNRDGQISRGGCTFCGDKAAGFESLSDTMSVSQQLRKNAEYIGKKYNAKKFIAYFQNFTNTYMPLDDFKNCLAAAAAENVVGIDVSTRPDCVSAPYLDEMCRIRAEKGVDVCLELGLQTVNYHTLAQVNRGHGLAEFIDAVLMAKNCGIPVCAHVILDLPCDSRTDVAETARVLSALRIDFVKMHSLYIVKNTKLAEEYKNGSIKLFDSDEYVQRAVLFLRLLSDKTVLQRIVSRAPEGDTEIVNSGISWWKIRDMILAEMSKLNAVQGDLCNYLGGSAVKKFV